MDELRRLLAAQSAAAEVLGQLRYSMPLWADDVFIGLACRFVGDRPGVAGRPSAGPGVVFDASFTWDDVAPGFDLGIGLNNAFDAEWSIPGSIEHPVTYIPQDGRALWAKLTYLF